MSFHEPSLYKRRTLVYDYPMKDYMAQLVLPRDMTEEEAEKLAAFVRTIYLPTPQEGEA
jgi:hypothetical protein